MNVNEFISECIDQAGYKFDDSRISRPALVHWAGKSIVNFFTETELCKEEAMGLVSAFRPIDLKTMVFYDDSQFLTDKKFEDTIVPSSFIITGSPIEENFSGNSGTDFIIPNFWRIVQNPLPFPDPLLPNVAYNKAAIVESAFQSPPGDINFIIGSGPVPWSGHAAMQNDFTGALDITDDIKNPHELEFEIFNDWEVVIADSFYGNQYAVAGYGERDAGGDLRVFTNSLTTGGTLLFSNLAALVVVHAMVVLSDFTKSYQVQIKHKKSSTSSTTTDIIIPIANKKEKIKIKYIGDSTYEFYRWNYSERTFSKIYELSKALFGNSSQLYLAFGKTGFVTNGFAPGTITPIVRISDIRFTGKKASFNQKLKDVMGFDLSQLELDEIASDSNFTRVNTKIYKIERVEYNGSFVNPATQEEIDQFVDMWRDVPPEDQPTHWWSTGEKIHFYPRTKKNGIVRIRYVAIPKPDAFVNDNDSLDALPYFNEGFQLRVVPRVVWLIKTRLRQDDALAYKQEYDDNVAKTKLEIADREPARMYTIRPANVGVRNIADRRPR